MGEVIYKMSKELFDEMRYNKRWNPGKKTMERYGKPRSKKDVISIINEQFGLLQTVTDINVM